MENLPNSKEISMTKMKLIIIKIFLGSLSSKLVLTTTYLPNSKIQTSKRLCES